MRSSRAPSGRARRRHDAMLINALNGLVYGSLLFVLSAGLVLFYGLRRVVNFANGALCMLGACIGYSAAIRFGIFSGVVHRKIRSGPSHFRRNDSSVSKIGGASGKKLPYQRFELRPSIMCRSFRRR